MITLHERSCRCDACFEMRSEPAGREIAELRRLVSLLEEPGDEYAPSWKIRDGMRAVAQELRDIADRLNQEADHY
jgi:hypothetical protein